MAHALAISKAPIGRVPIDRIRTADCPGPQAEGFVRAIPWRLALALQADGWTLRSDIIWHKVNCMPESVQDRPTRSHEYLFMFSKQERYFWDQDAIREPLTGGYQTQEEYQSRNGYGQHYHEENSDPKGGGFRGGED